MHIDRQLYAYTHANKYAHIHKHLRSVIHNQHKRRQRDDIKDGLKGVRVWEYNGDRKVMPREESQNK